jgi:hypothetical protein
VDPIELIRNTDWLGPTFPFGPALILLAEAAYGITTAAALVHLHRRAMPAIVRLAWCAVTLVPLFGPLFVVAFSDVPPVQPPVLRGRRDHQ